MTPRISGLIKFLVFLTIFFTLRATFTLVVIDNRSDFYKDTSQGVSYEDVVRVDSQQIPRDSEVEDTGNYSSFKGISYPTALYRITSQDKVAIISLIDWGFIDMALNFYETSLSPFGIENYLFLASDERSCVFLSKIGISCYVYIIDEAGKQASEYQR